MLLLLAQAATTVDGNAAVALGAGAAAGVVLVFAAARLLPFFGAWLRGHNHPLAAEGADVAAEYAQAIETGKTPLQAFESTMRSPEAQDLVAKAVAHFRPQAPAAAAPQK